MKELIDKVRLIEWQTPLLIKLEVMVVFLHFGASNAFPVLSNVMEHAIVSDVNVSVIVLKKYCLVLLQERNETNT